jgi:magnesium transporter
MRPDDPGPVETRAGAIEDAVPEPVAERAGEPTGEVSMLPPEEASKVAAEIRAVAEARGGDGEEVELAELQKTIPIRTILPEDDDALSSDELRDAWPLLDLEERSDGLRVLAREDAEDFFIALPATDQAALLLHFRPGQRRQWMRLLEPDDAADVIQEAGDQHRAMLLNLLDAPTRKEVNALLAYAEDEAGGLMSTRYARLRPNMTADEAISYLRRQAQDKIETIYYAYVVDPDQHLLGVVSFRDLFASEPKKVVSGVMETDVVRVSDEMDQETVSRIFAESDLTVIPVVDKDGKMKGIVTVDDIIDVVQEEATEDAQKFGGMEALDLPYLQSTPRELFWKRGKWLAVLLFGGMLTTIPLGYFETQIHAITMLALFLPMITGSGGNSGSQASTLIVRAMALGQIRMADWWLVLRREVLMGLSLGLLLGAIAAIRVIGWGAVGGYSTGTHYVLIGVTVAATVIGSVVCGTLAGSMLPFVLKRLGADPASASAPLVTTIVDTCGIVIYLTVTNIVLASILP